MADEKIIEGQSNKLTTEQVEAVVEFSKGLYLADGGGFFTPFMSNQLLKSLNNNPLVPTSDSIKKALSNYKNSGNDIRSYTEFMANFDMLFKRTLYSYVNSLSFDLEYVPTNCYTKSDYESDEYKSDKRIISDFLNSFKYKQEFYNVVLNVMRMGRYFTWFRRQKWGAKGQMKYALQIMPQSDEWVIPTGYFEQGILCSMNMMYFLTNVGVDIDGYDPSLKKTLKRTLEANNVTYVPHAQLNDRKGVYSLWADVSPNDGAFMFTWNPTDFSELPYLAPFLKNVVSNDEIAKLQENKDMISAYGILAGAIRLFDNAKSGTQSNQFAIDPKTLGAFMAKAKAGIGSLVKILALPTEENHFYQFEDKNPDMSKTQSEITAGNGTSISRVVYSTDRVSNAELQAQLNETYQTMRPLYRQFENFLNFYVNKMKLHYKWRFMFDGSNYAFERDARFDKLCKIADRGLVLPSHSWASALGYEPQIFDAMLSESKNTGWLQEVSQLMLNTNTTPQGDNLGGRPQQDASTLTESGESSRNNS